MSASSIVYWNCVRLTRLSICKSCTTWKNTEVPSTPWALTRSRRRISAALALRA